MAVDYSSLQTEIISWCPSRLGDAAFVAAVPSFISDAEHRFNRKLRIRLTEQIATSTITSADGSLGLPGDYLELRSLQILTNPPTAPVYVTPEKLAVDQQTQSLTYTGNPVEFTIIGNEVVFWPPPAAGSNLGVSFVYWASVPPLATNTTNALLTTHPDLYRYAALVYAALWEGDDTAAQKWEGIYQNILTELKEVDERSEFPGLATIRTDVTY